MMQCIICEDWFHSQVRLDRFFVMLIILFQHLGVSLPMEENDIDQMDIICQTCVTKYPFLVHYNG